MLVKGKFRMIAKKLNNAGCRVEFYNISLIKDIIDNDNYNLINWKTELESSFTSSTIQPNQLDFESVSPPNFSPSSQPVPAPIPAAAPATAPADPPLRQSHSPLSPTSHHQFPVEFPQLLTPFHPPQSPLASLSSLSQQISPVTTPLSNYQPFCNFSCPVHCNKA
ncbi:hypothetical protein RCL_jg7077.t1 [Rhizophagus clarus]|uniref:Uncharacterized protein n=1 Tax=Rhizophagus clarus TaxID=94130 RepID=A0A8H3LYB3_9GLOM|nr:hypothetical protein RCL_jg7077.t1 [Rhizophagus clarus]